MIGAFAKALEIIPRQICNNAGLDATDILNKLRMLHAKGETWSGVDVENEGVGDNLARFVWEPSLVKINALEGATEAACLVLSVDETVTNPKSQAVRPFTLFRSPTRIELTWRRSNPLDPKPREVLSVQSEVEDARVAHCATQLLPKSKFKKVVQPLKLQALVILGCTVYSFRAAYLLFSRIRFP